MVEDEPSIIKVTKTMLERLGYTILSATTPKEAILDSDVNFIRKPFSTQKLAKKVQDVLK